MARTIKKELQVCPRCLGNAIILIKGKRYGFIFKSPPISIRCVACKGWGKIECKEQIVYTDGRPDKIINWTKEELLDKE